MPKSAIIREIHEETGIIFNDVSELVSLPMKVGALEGYFHYFVCKNPITYGDPLLDSGGEKITIEYVNFDTFMEYTTSDSGFARYLANHIIATYILTGKTEEFKQLLLA